MKLFRFSGSTRDDHNNPFDCNFLSLLDAMTPDVIAPSPWKIFGCQNGLRLFKEAEDSNICRRRGDLPAIMAVGVVDGTPEDIFSTLMSLGPSRSEWDFCFHKGRVIENLDDHTEIIHQQLYNDWLPWKMKRRDLLLRRYWRKEIDGTYVILFHSVLHNECPPVKGYARACLKSGGYVIIPVNGGKQCVIKHMLAVDWKIWKLYARMSSTSLITVRMVNRVAALREMFRISNGNTSLLSTVVTKYVELPRGERDNVKIKNRCTKGTKKIEDLLQIGVLPHSSHTYLNDLTDADDEFFDVLEPSELHLMDKSSTKMSTASVFVKKLNEFAAHKKGYMELRDEAKENQSYYFGTTFCKDPTNVLACSWAMADPSTFLIRGVDYFRDHKKVNATCTLMQLAAADWLKSEKREDDLGGRIDGIVQKYATQGGPEFFFIINIQIPGATKYNLVLYYVMRKALKDHPLLERFVNGDNAFRNSRFKLIPYISEGSWIVKQSVGKKACMVGHALDVNYFKGDNYLELAIDVGSSTVARGVINLVLGYLNNLVVEMAFLIQGNAEEELPEVLLGTCRLNHMDVSKAATIPKH